MSKTNRELNQEFDARQQARVRPKTPAFNPEPLEQVIRKWVEMRKAREQA